MRNNQLFIHNFNLRNFKPAFIVCLTILEFASISTKLNASEQIVATLSESVMLIVS